MSLAAVFLQCTITGLDTLRVAEEGGIVGHGMIDDHFWYFRSCPDSTGVEVFIATEPGEMTEEYDWYYSKVGACEETEQAKIRIVEAARQWLTRDECGLCDGRGVLEDWRIKGERVEWYHRPCLICTSRPRK